MARTVLLADDSPTIQRVVELTFAGESVRVVSVGDGAAAIDAIRQSPPDVVLADIGMPERTGYDVLAFVRSQPALSGVRVLLLAGAFETVDLVQAARLGADGVLTKPFDPALLVDRVTELLTHRRGAAQPPASSTPHAASPQHPASNPPDREQYFEAIDQAFAALSRTPRPPLAPAEDEPLPPHDADATPTPLPAVSTAPQNGVEPAAVPLTDAFAAILDAEQTGTPIEDLWRPARDNVAAEGMDIERLADLVARRVLEQLSDRVVRETVSQLVSTTAERLVREEIERIKRHIK